MAETTDAADLRSLPLDAWHRDRGAVALPEDVYRELTRNRKPGDPDAAVDPLSDPKIRDAVAKATFEQLIGFQLTQAQLRYNATR